MPTCDQRLLKLSLSGPVWLICLLSVLASCAARRQPIQAALSCTTASSRLSEAWHSLSQLTEPSGQCAREDGARCEAYRAQIERLSVDCPVNPDVLMANVILAFESQNFLRAKQLLDELSASGVPNPDAAAMRARLALKQGNLQYAIKYLAQQIKQTGDHAGLRETYASALYLSGKWDEAEKELTAALKLGAPDWRVAFGKGLVEEARGRFFEAKLQYVEALRAKPEWRQPQSRLRALVVSGKVTELFESK